MLAPTTASAATTREIVPFQGTIRGCSGERIVTVRGQLLLITRFSEDPSGGFHAIIVFVPRRITAVSSSGVTYRVVGGDRQAFYFRLRSGRETATFTRTVEFPIISEGGEDQLLTRTTFHSTMSANGVITVVDKFSEMCVG
jgi:hypothetical protein